MGARHRLEFEPRFIRVSWFENTSVRAWRIISVDRKECVMMSCYDDVL